MRRLVLVVGTAAAITCCGGCAIASAASLHSLEGRWSGTGHTRQNYESGPLPVSFVVKDGKVEQFTLGPAKVACRPQFEGGPASFFATMPKLHGFPTVRIRPQLKEFTALFLGSTTTTYAISHDVVIPPSTPVTVEVGGFFLGRTFKGVGASTIEVSYAANEHGEFEAGGPYTCLGGWSGAAATHRR